jgi:hypothetical protein
MIAAAQLRRRLLQGDTYEVIAASLGITADALRKRAARLGVKSTVVLGRHRRRPEVTYAEMVRRKEKGWQRDRQSS